MNSIYRFSMSVVLSLCLLAGGAFADPMVVNLVGSGPVGWDNGLWAGDGQPSAGAFLNAPIGLTRASNGSLVIADFWNDRLRAVDDTGTIRTIAGDGWPGNITIGTPDGTSLWGPWGVAPKGTSIVFTDTFNSGLRSVNADGTLTQLAGTYRTASSGFGSFNFGVAAYNGDGQTAATAQLNWPLGVCTDGAGNIYVADSWNQRIRKIDTAGNITTVAGNGWADLLGRGRFSGDNGPATSACLNWPTAVCVDTQGNLYIADTYNLRIRRVNAQTGVITTVAGNGSVGGAGDEAPATQATLNYPMGLALGTDGTLYIADTMNNRIRSVTADGVIHAVAGNGIPGKSGDNGSALLATFREPMGLTTSAEGDLIVADTGNNAVRMVLFGSVGTVSGLVRDANTSAALPGATVTWNGLQATADANGHFVLVAREGQQAITARKATYGPVTATLSIVAGADTPHDFLLPSGVVMGDVVDDTGQAIGGATVSGLDNAATTAPDGTFSMRLGPGSQFVVATKPGYAPSDKTEAIVNNGESTQVHLVLHGIRSIPVALAYSMDWISSDANSGDYDSSLFDTAFPSEQLPASNSIFSLTDSFGTVDFVFPDKADGAKNVILTSGQTLAVSPAHYAGLHFLEAACKGAASGPVVLSYADGTQTTVPLTWSDWAWNAVGAQLGSNETPAISCTHRHSPTNANSAPPVDILHSAVPVDASRVLVSVTLPTRTTGGQACIFAVSLDGLQGSVGAVQGVVKNAANGTPITGATVTWNGIETNTDSSGTYRLTILGGTQTLAASAPGYAAATTSLNVASGQTTIRDFALTPANVAGVVVDDAMHVVAGATVSAASGPSVTTAVDGTFALTLAAGSQTLTASKAGHTASAPAAITVTSGQTVTVQLMINRAAGPGTTLQVPLTYGFDWISSHTNPGDYLTYGTDYGFPAEELPGSNAMFNAPTPSGNENFMFPDKTDGARNVVWANGQAIDVPDAHYTGLHFLEAAQYGAFTGSVRLNYTDGTSTSTSLTFTDWARNTVGPNENIAVTCTHRHRAGSPNSTPAVYIFQSQMAVNTSKVLASFTLPSDGNGQGNSDPYVFAATLDVPPPMPLYGDVNGDNTVTVADALAALRNWAGITTLSAAQKNRADVCPVNPDGSFGDGLVQLSDCVEILQMAQH